MIHQFLLLIFLHYMYSVWSIMYLRICLTILPQIKQHLCVYNALITYISHIIYVTIGNVNEKYLFLILIDFMNDILIVMYNRLKQPSNIIEKHHQHKIYVLTLISYSELSWYSGKVNDCQCHWSTLLLQ